MQPMKTGYVWTLQMQDIKMECKNNMQDYENKKLDKDMYANRRFVKEQKTKKHARKQNNEKKVIQIL